MTGLMLGVTLVMLGTRVRGSKNIERMGMVIWIIGVLILGVIIGNALLVVGG